MCLEDVLILRIINISIDKEGGGGVASSRGAGDEGEKDGVASDGVVLDARKITANRLELFKFWKFGETVSNSTCFTLMESKMFCVGLNYL